MQFQLTYRLSRPLELPLGHHDVLQGYLYKNLSMETEFARLLHESGYSKEGRTYKLFVFGPLEGKHEIKGGSIIFYDEVRFEVRSPMPDFCDNFVRVMMHADRHALNHQRIDLESIEIRNQTISEERIRVRMKSPICLSNNIIVNGKRKTLYFSPDMEEYGTLLNQNFQSKLFSATRTDFQDKLEIRPLHVSEKDKYVTKFKGIYITAWNGVYEMKGPARALTFLYNTGLGSRNSQGFGMFELISL